MGNDSAKINIFAAVDIAYGALRDACDSEDDVVRITSSDKSITLSTTNATMTITTEKLSIRVNCGDYWTDQLYDSLPSRDDLRSRMYEMMDSVYQMHRVEINTARLQALLDFLPKCVKWEEVKDVNGDTHYKYGKIVLRADSDNSYWLGYVPCCYTIRTLRRVVIEKLVNMINDDYDKGTIVDEEWRGYRAMVEELESRKAEDHD